MKDKKWYTLMEASEYLSRCKRQIIRYVDEGSLKGYQTQYRGTWLFDIKDLDAWVMFNTSFAKLTKPQKEQLN